MVANECDRKRLKGQLFRAMFSLVARVIATDDTLSAGEREMLCHIFQWPEDSNEALEFTRRHLSEWTTVEFEYPDFLWVAVRHDRTEAPDFSERLINLIKQAGILASIADSEDFVSAREDWEDQEIGIITGYGLGSSGKDVGFSQGPVEARGSGLAALGA